MAEDARFGRAKVGLASLDALFGGIDRVLDRPALIDRYADLRPDRECPVGRGEAVRRLQDEFGVAALDADVGQTVGARQRDRLVEPALPRARAGQRRIVFIRLGQRLAQRIGLHSDGKGQGHQAGADKKGKAHRVISFS